MKWRYYGAIGAYCAFIFWISHQSRPPGSSIDFENSDKVAHFLVYAVLATLISVGLHRAPRTYRPAVLHGVPIVFASLYGISDEVHQLFVPGRTFSYQDMMADALGAVAGHGACLFFFRIRPQGNLSEEEGTS